MLFGFVLDFAGGSGREAAWIAAFTMQAALARPGRWFTSGAVLKPDKQFCHDRTEPIADGRLPQVGLCLPAAPKLFAVWLACPLSEALIPAVLAAIGFLSQFSAKTFEPSCERRVGRG